MTFGLRCSGPVRRPHPASLPVRVPTVEGLPPASFSFALRLRLAVRLRLPSSAPIGSFHPIRFRPCWAHPAAEWYSASLSTDTAYLWLRLCCSVGQAVLACLARLRPILSAAKV